MGRGVPRHVRRVLRGGAFNNNRQDVRAAYRNNNDPANRNNNVGFRVCCELSHIFFPLPGDGRLPIRVCSLPR